MGPIYESLNAPDGSSLLAIRPFYSKFNDPVRERTSSSVLWPLYTANSFREEKNWRFLTAMNFHQETQARDRFWIFPFYFQGKDSENNQYRALFPFGGHLHDFLGRDYLKFVMFPIYSYSKINDVETSSWFWPIYSRTKGPDINRMRIFPFYGKSELTDNYEKKFIMWPFWSSVKHYRSGSSGSGYLFFPFWGHVKLENHEAWTLIPPLFSYRRDNDKNEIYSFWPFFERRIGKEDKLYIWPVWGRKNKDKQQSSFWLWPIIRYTNIEKEITSHTSFSVLPFIYSKQIKSIDEQPQPVLENYLKIWPLVSYQRKNDACRVRLLELWPLNSKPIEQNWAPLWTLYTHSSNKGQAVTELLWGLYRRKANKDGYRYNSVFPLCSWEKDMGQEEYKWSILKGLISYKRKGDRNQVGLLYWLRFGDRDID